jgi:hypothetical protein
VLGQAGVLPGRARGGPVARGDGEPAGVAEVAVLRGAVLVDENAGPDVADREERDGIVTGFVQQQHVVAVGDPLAGELHAHAAAQRFGEQQPFRKRRGGEELADRAGAQWALLP